MKRLLLFAVILMFVSGCAFNSQSKPEKIAKNLSAGKTTLTSVAGTVDQMCSDALLNQSQCDKAAKVYAKAKLSHNVASDALLIAIAADTDSTWQSMSDASAYFNETLADLMALINGWSK